MKLHYKINLTSLVIMVIVSSALVITGSMAITNISYNLNRKLLFKEINNLRADIQSAIDVLRQSGVEGVESYKKRAQQDILADFKRYAEEEENYNILIIRKSDGKVLLHPPSAKEDYQFLRDLIKKDTGSTSHIYQGKSRFFCFHSFEEWDWVIVLYESSEKLLEMRKLFLESVLVILVISLAAGSFYLVWSTSRIVAPIRQLAKTADEISHGKWNSSFPPSKGRDEISQLTKSFQEMSENLAATYQDLNEHLAEIKKSQNELSAEKERLAITLRSIGDGVITTDPEGKITLLNKVAEELTGWSQEEATGQPVDKVFHVVTEEQDSETAYISILKFLYAGPRSDFGNQTRLISRKGDERIISVSGAPIFGADERTIGIILVFHDITESVTMQEELIKAYKLESVGILAGGIAHDFNNLLTGILGNISLAKIIAANDKELVPKLDAAEKASLRAKDLTKQLLTFSKGGEPVKNLISLKKVIGEAASFALAGSNCKCDCQTASDLWSVEADEGQISQVLHNLIINAGQAMPVGGSISVVAKNVDVNEQDNLLLEPGRYVKISVQDRGIGIDRESLSKIFDPYYTTKKEGSGLGLASAYSIIAKHFGQITVESEKGKGSIFSFYLPASKKKAKATEWQKKNLNIGFGRVLVVDDEEIVKDVTGMMLVSLGYRVDFADDGEEAIAMYMQKMDEGNRYDLVIMDLTIPGGMGGKEAIQILKREDPEILAIVSSGYANDPVMANFQKYGFSAVISKPFSIDELSKTLSELEQH